MNLIIGNMILVQNVQKPPVASHLKSLRFFSNSAVKIHDSQAYRNMEMKRELITIDQRNMVLSFQIGFSFVRVAVACAIPGMESLSEY